MATKKPNPKYYYASGQRVALEPADDLVAVDEERLAQKWPDLLLSDAALKAGKSLRGGIRLVERQALDAGTLDRLKVAGLTQPVFRHDGAILVALPEVRVEDDSVALLAKVQKFAAKKAKPIESDAEGQLTLQPLSSDGGDALSLANDIAENYQLASVSPRFLRIVPGPVVRT